MLQAVTPEPTAIVEVTHAAANAEAAAPAVAASDAAFNRAGEEELQSEGSASTAIKEATSSLLTDVDQDVILMSRGPVSNVRESVLLPSMAGSMHADGNSADLVSGMIVEQPAMTMDESESIMCGEVDTILDDLTSTAGVAVPVQSVDNSLMPDAAPDTDSIMDRLLIDVGGTGHDSQHAEQSSVLLEAEEDKVLYDVPTPFSGSSPDAMVIAAADTDGLTNGLIADTAAAGESLNEQQAGLPMALEVDTDRITDRLLTEVSMDGVRSTQQEEQGSSNPIADDVDDLLDDLVTTAAVPLPAHTEIDPVSKSETEAEAEIANAEPQLVRAEPQPVSTEPQALSTEAELETRVRPESIAAAAVLTPEDAHADLAVTEESDFLMTKEVDSILDDMTTMADRTVPVGMGMDGSDRPDVSDRPEQLETESVLEGRVADAAEVPQYLPSSGKPSAVLILLLASRPLDLLVHSDPSSKCMTGQRCQPGYICLCTGRFSHTDWHMGIPDLSLHLERCAANPHKTETTGFGCQLQSFVHVAIVPDIAVVRHKISHDA